MSKIKVNEQRAVDEFQELTAIDAPSFGEERDSWTGAVKWNVPGTFGK